jgi:hypothetical protein
MSGRRRRDASARQSNSGLRTYHAGLLSGQQSDAIPLLVLGAALFIA